MLPLLGLSSWFPSSLPVAMAMYYQAADLLPCGMFALIVGAGRLPAFSVILSLVARQYLAYVT